MTKVGDTALSPMPSTLPYSILKVNHVFQYLFQVLCFAGEATNTHYYSTVHGAVESGWREAERLIKFLK